MPDSKVLENCNACLRTMKCLSDQTKTTMLDLVATYKNEWYMLRTLVGACLVRTRVLLSYNSTPPLRMGLVYSNMYCTVVQLNESSPSYMTPPDFNENSPVMHVNI